MAQFGMWNRVISQNEITDRAGAVLSLFPVEFILTSVQIFPQIANQVSWETYFLLTLQRGWSRGTSAMWGWQMSPMWRLSVIHRPHGTGTEFGTYLIVIRKKICQGKTLHTIISLNMA